MKDHEDAFGHALHDYYQGKKAQIIIERDDGNLDVSGEPASYFRDFDEWDEYEQEAMNAVRGRILDLGSGAGRHSLYLQNRGHDVVALDNSPLAIEVVKRRGVRDTALMPVTQISSRLGTFETIIMMGNNFGLLADKRRARWLLRRFYKMTSPEARIVTTSLNPRLTDDPLHLACHERNRRRGRMIGQVRIRVRYRNLKGLWFDYLLVSKEEMEEISNSAGWMVSKIIESEGPMYAAIIEKAQ
ncbi:MAG: class I SAM-dependent methyltransferase [Candidatus Promineifilaceae bacterium]